LSGKDGKEEIISAMDHFEQVHQKYLPKVDRRFVIDLFMHLRSHPDRKPMYTVEFFLKEGGDHEEIRNEVIRLTGMAPDFYDKGTHVVVNFELDYDSLKSINDRPQVVEVKGRYSGSMASIGPSFEASEPARDAEEY
jgi:hypothetical protein